MFGLWNCNSHYYYFWTRATTVSCTRQTLFQNGIQNERLLCLILCLKLNIIIAPSIPFWTTACRLIHRSFEFLLDPFLTPWSIYWSIAPSIAPLVTSIAHSFAPWSIACFLSFNFSAFYINRSFYCSPILRLLPDP